MLQCLLEKGYLIVQLNNHIYEHRFKDKHVCLLPNTKPDFLVLQVGEHSSLEVSSAARPPFPEDMRTNALPTPQVQRSLMLCSKRRPAVSADDWQTKPHR